MRWLRRGSVLLVGLTFLLVVWGGVVHTTASSLACPDWPLCFGQVFPPMRGGIFYEHGHRLLASVVLMITFVLVARLWRYSNRGRNYLVLGPALVLLQATLGALTVIYRLPPLISIAHWCTSMLFFAWAVGLAQAMAPDDISGHTLPTPPAETMTKLHWALPWLFLQMALGAVCRHAQASLSCGVEVLTCAGQWLPRTWLQWLQSLHRFNALIVFVLIIVATLPILKWARQQKLTSLRQTVVAIHLLLTAQMLLGVLTIKTAVHLHVVTAHVGMGAALWAGLVWLWLILPSPSSSRAAVSPPLDKQWANHVG